ncbi:NADP-dependent oxidoreductase [Micromonospora sp. WMMD1102]|uniref:NADP-dependent oxidoreductase n=1 Tax=Micromonospora sp. WMMD1102 TaxID=3016105 RepID=UPI0024152598|nr:NADP-dependent oxidoreductase [Micromonospora sp. WMMD1102]MDG4789571.1 NADP-dependent oxidoreductase [Micromonospora sp. WMMD1102]
MRAVVIDSPGPPGVLRPAEVPEPVPGDDEVLLRVAAAGVNAIDWATRAGAGVAVPAFPAVLGWDVCGTVAAPAGQWRAGDQVFGMLRFPVLAGAYAEYVAAPAAQLARVPDGVDAHTAAALPMAALTVWQTLVTHGGLTAGQRVLVPGAAGGVGHVAVQLAAALGAEVTGTASRANHDFVCGLGASRVVPHDGATARAGEYDVVIDPRGGADFERLLSALRPGGIIVTLKGEAPGMRDLARARGVRAGFTYVQPDGAVLADVADMMAGGGLTAAIERVLPLTEAASAHEIGEAGHVRGKLVLAVA